MVGSVSLNDTVLGRLGAISAPQGHLAPIAGALMP